MSANLSLCSIKYKISTPHTVRQPGTIRNPILRITRYEELMIWFIFGKGKDNKYIFIFYTFKNSMRLYFSKTSSIRVMYFLPIPFIVKSFTDAFRASNNSPKVYI